VFSTAKTINGVHTRKSRTQVMLFSKSIGAILGRTNWWISPITINRYDVSLAPQ
jgi:hypothetical protein